MNFPTQRKLAMLIKTIIEDIETERAVSVPRCTDTGTYIYCAEAIFSFSESDDKQWRCEIGIGDCCQLTRDQLAGMVEVIESYDCVCVMATHKDQLRAEALRSESAYKIQVPKSRNI